MQAITDIFILNLLSIITVGLIFKVYASKHHLKPSKKLWALRLWFRLTLVFSVIYAIYLGVVL